MQVVPLIIIAVYLTIVV